MAGRRTCWPNSFAKSLLRTGCGAQALYGPCASAVCNKWSINATSSCKCTHGIHCWPLPCLPPRPKRNTGNNRDKNPPWLVSTNPVRTNTTRIPKGCAACAATSQSAHNCVAKSGCWIALLSVSSCSPPSPYQPTAEPEINTSGLCSKLANQLTRRSVKAIRLSRNKVRRAWVQGRSAIGAPAKLITASNGTAFNSLNSRTGRTAAPQIACTCSGLRLHTYNSWPCANHNVHKLRPIRPVPPVIKIRIAKIPCRLHCRIEQVEALKDQQLLNTMFVSSLNYRSATNTCTISAIKYKYLLYTAIYLRNHAFSKESLCLLLKLPLLVQEWLALPRPEPWPQQAVTSKSLKKVVVVAGA